MPAKKAAKKVTGATKKTPAKKVTAKKVAMTKTPAAKKAVPAKKVAAKSPVKPTVEAIARAAYINYLKRMENGLPGDSESDWLEAERSLTQA